MKSSSFLALSLALLAPPAFAQTNQGSSPLTGPKGGTNNAFMQFIGPSTTLKTYLLPDQNDTIATLAAAQTFTAAKTWNLNTAAAPVPDSGTILHVVAADSAIARIEATSLGAQSFFSARRANGTNASPSALATDDHIGALNFHGYSGLSFSGPQASVGGYAGGAWTSTSLPAYLDFKTTDAGSTALTTRMRVEKTGAVTVPNTVTGGDKGAGTINVQNGVYVGGVLVATTARTINTTAPLNGGGNLSVDRTISINANGISYSLVQQVAALSLLGNCTNSSANVAESTGAANQIMRVNGAGTSCGFGTIDLSQSAAVGSSVLGVANGGSGAATASGARTNLGVAIGTNVQAWDSDLDALAANTTPGLWASTGVGTGAARSLTAPAAGLTITNPAGTSGNPTFALANDLAALEALSGTGFAVRSATDTWLQRSIGGTANEIAVANGDGVAGAPIISLPSALTFTGKTVTGGTFNSPAINTPTGIVKGDVGLGSVDNTSDVTKWGATKTLTNTTFNCGSTGNVCTVRLGSDVTGLGTGVASALAVALNASGGVVGYSGNLGTPTAGVLTNATGLPPSGLTTQANNTFVGNFSGSSASPSAGTPTQATAALNPCVGDSGLGGTKGLVPAPGAGDAAANKVLSAGCSWVAQSGGGGSYADVDRQNALLDSIYISKANGACRRQVNRVADGFKATDCINLTSSSYYSVNTTNGYVGPSTSSGTTRFPTNMTAASSPSPYVTTDDLHNSTSAAWKMFDGSGSTYWDLYPSPSTQNAVIDLGSGNAVSISSYSLSASSVGTHGGYMIKNWTVEGSNDNSTFTVLDTQTNQTSWADGETRSFTLASTSSAYRYYKLKPTAGNNSSEWLVATFQATGPGTYSNMTLVTAPQPADTSVSYGRLLCEYNDGGVSMTPNTDFTGEVTGNFKSATVTISIASPGVVTQTAHGLSANAPVTPATTGALPTGLTQGVQYYVKTVIDTNNYTLSASSGGTAINTSGSQSGTHTMDFSTWTAASMSAVTSYGQSNGSTNRKIVESVDQAMTAGSNFAGRFKNPTNKNFQPFGCTMTAH